MKKTVVLIFVVLCGLQIAYSQQSVYTNQPQRLFSQGKEMFLNANYQGTINTLEEFKKRSKDAQMIVEADYMLVSSFFYQGNENALELLQDFLEQHPESYHRQQICFFIASTYFVAKEWDKALLWFYESDINYLSPVEQEDYAYRAGYANIQLGNNKDARNYFYNLTRNSEKYIEPASYYLAYIEFQEGNYAKALPVFRQLKNKQEYKENATFFLVQGAYIEGNSAESITEANDFIASYPQSKNLAEVHRLLANSYYREGDNANAIKNYEKYEEQRQDSEFLFRQDAYQLGDAYYKTGRFGLAANALRKVASSEDVLGQAGYMLLGQSLLKTENTANALLAFDAAARAKFDNAISEEALYNYVLLVNRESISAFGQSITAFQRFYEAYPNSKYIDNVNKALSTTLLSTKNYNVALEAIKTIKTPGKQILEAKQMILFQYGIQKFIDTDYTAASENFNACLGMGNYNVEAKHEALFWRGETFYRTADYKLAANDYTTYIAQVSPSAVNYNLALYNLGYALFQTKNYNAALASFKQYVMAKVDRQSPQYPDALNRIGDCSLFARNYAEADRYYSQAATVNPTNADYSEFQKAFVKGLQRDYTAKVAALNSMMAKYPDSQYYDDALFEKSRALVMQDKEEEAIKVLEGLLKGYPSSNLIQEAGVQLGQLYFNANNPQQSIAAYKLVVTNYPNTEAARIAIQSLEGVYKDIDDIGSYASFVNSLGGSMVLSTSRQDSLTYLAAENVYMKGNKAEARTTLNKYLQTYPQGTFASDAHFYLGSMAFEGKDNVTALKHFKEVVASNNTKYRDDALIYSSGIDFDNENYADAYTAYEHLLLVAETVENKGVAQVGMLRCAYLLRKDNEVVLSADKLLKESKLPYDIANEAQFYRAKALLKLARTDEAIKGLLLVAKDTRNVFGAESQYILAETYYQSKLYDKVESQVLAFMKEGTAHEYWMARAVIVLANVYMAKGEDFQARQYVESLKANYKGAEPDIAASITAILTALKK